MESILSLLETGKWNHRVFLSKSHFTLRIHKGRSITDFRMKMRVSSFLARKISDVGSGVNSQGEENRDLSLSQLDESVQKDFPPLLDFFQKNSSTFHLMYREFLFSSSCLKVNNLSPSVSYAGDRYQSRARYSLKSKSTSREDFIKRHQQT